MKNVILISLFLISCAPKPSNTLSKISVAPTSTIIGVWKNSLQEIDFSQVVLNQEVAADKVLVCNGGYALTTVVGGVQPGGIKINGDGTQGTLQFGQLKYVGASDGRCIDYSREAMTYVVAGDVLTLCYLSYSHCENFTRE